MKTLKGRLPSQHPDFTDRAENDTVLYRDSHCSSFHCQFPNEGWNLRNCGLHYLTLAPFLPPFLTLLHPPLTVLLFFLSLFIICFLYQHLPT